MMLFRNARESDLDAIYHLAEHSGFGITSLSKDKKVLAKRVKLACSSFKQKVEKPDNEFYLFVLENPDSGELIGVSAIEAASGHDAPLYSYKITKRTRICHPLAIRSDYEILNLVNDNQGRSELRSLYLKPEFRHSSNGLLLSRGRFLFMAHFPERFTPTIIAEMRGISDDWGNSPFWDSIGRHFFHMSFAEADALIMTTNKQFIADLMPRSPLYIKLLPKEAQDVIAKPHASTIPAMNLLIHEGFRFNSTVDIFDAGPTIEAELRQIRTVANNRLMTIKNLSDEISSKLFLLANTKVDFRATMAMALFNYEQQTCLISKETAKLLKVKPGDKLRIAPLHIEDSSWR